MNDNYLYFHFRMFSRIGMEFVFEVVFSVYFLPEYVCGRALMYARVERSEVNGGCCPAQSLYAYLLRQGVSLNAELSSLPGKSALECIFCMLELEVATMLA